VVSVYQCAVNNNPNIRTKESAQISGISGTHQSSKNNDDVTGFYADRKRIQFFPKGLNKIFKNLKFIFIHKSQLKEIHQSDLKVFPNLVYFYLVYNKIAVIEAGLFDFNPKLELVVFWESKIIHIDPNVFDNLNKLRYLWFEYVLCVDQNIFNSREQVQEAIKVVKSNCSNSEYLELDNQIKNLKIDFEILNSPEFNVKLEIFEKNLENSKFTESSQLNDRIQNPKVKSVNLVIKLNLMNEKSLKYQNLIVNNVNFVNRLIFTIILTLMIFVLLFFCNSYL